jgi:hypothetical protein
MSADRANFEVQIFRDGRWATETVSNREEEARTLAKKFLADKKCAGARIIRNWMRGDGMMVESEIFSETRTIKEDESVRITPIDSVPPTNCETQKDFLGNDARGVVNRVFRSYLDKAFLTPTELLHNHKELKRLQDKDTLVPSAVDRVAFLQTREGEQDAKSRREDIFKNIDQIAARARKAETMTLPKLGGRFSDLVAKLSEMGEGDSENRDYLALVVLSRDLVDVRNWVGKLERLCALAIADTDPHAVTLLDGVIADVLGSNVVQEILGFQPSLCSAICRMFDLADGKMPTEKSEAGESAVSLNRLFAEKKLPASRACLMDRAHRQIRAAAPLCRNDPTKEAEEFKRLVLRVLCPAGLLAGSETAEALTARYGRMVEQGGAAGRRAAIAGTFRTLPDRATAIIYLSELMGTPLGEENAADIAELLGQALASHQLSELCDRALSAKERMQRATIAHRVASASAFPPPVKTRILDHIDGLLERYLIDEQIIEKLDHADSHLRDRASRLVQFCAAGVLPEGKALARARHHILALLRQPNFEAHFIDGIADPVKAQKTVRDFHQLLVRAGFG